MFLVSRPMPTIEEEQDVSTPRLTSERSWREREVQEGVLRFELFCILVYINIHCMYVYIMYMYVYIYIVYNDRTIHMICMSTANPS